MATDLCIEIHAGELFQIVESVFGTMLRLNIYPSEAPWFPSGDRLTSAVHLTGDWNGAILVECDRQQACRFAGHFLSMEPSDTVDDVVRDVLGELANMIGGNVKGVLSLHIHLSMPSVMDGNDYSLRVCGAEMRERLAFRCSVGIFWVSVLTLKS